MRSLLFGIAPRWRGFAVERTVFGSVLRVGRLYVGVSPYDIPEWVAEWHGKLEAALSKSRAKPSSGKGQQS